MATYGDLQLGDTAKDTITGVEGVVVCISNWLNGCQTISLQPRKLHEGKPVERLAFDTEQLTLISRREVPKTKKETGGPAVVIRSGRE